jgi:hemoglobin
MTANEQLASTHFELVGGQPAVDRIVDAFYRRMDTLPQAATIRAMHPPDLAGTRTLLKKYLGEWLGGPTLYSQERGHPRLRMRHLPFRIGVAERDAWMLCMSGALEEVVGSVRLRDLLTQQLFKTADWMRNDNNGSGARDASTTVQHPGLTPLLPQAAAQADGAAVSGNLPGRPCSERLSVWLRASDFPPNDLLATRANRTTALMHAARLGEPDIVNELLTLGAALNLRNADGNNALWLACYSGNVTVVRALIAAGIDLDNRNDNGATCLMYAASAGKTEVVATLLAAGANLKFATLDGFAALDMAANLDCLQLLRQADRQSSTANHGAA